MTTSRWRLRFDDPALERAFRDDYFERTLRQMRFVILAGLGVLLALAAGLHLEALQAVLRGSRLAPDARLLAVARVYFMVELPFVAAVAVLSFTRWFRRAGQAALALAGFMVLFAMTVGARAAPAGYASWFFAFTLVASLVPMYVGTRLRFPYAAVTFPAASASYLAAALDRDDLGQVAVIAAWVVLINAFGLVLLWQSERFARSEFHSRRTIAAQREELRAEQEKSERLLLEVLPASIAARLKAGESIADRFADVSVLFADIVGFTPWSQSVPPEEVVRRLGAIFSRFDEIARSHRLEKIKTIGDAYMVAAGLPEARADHAEALARMALDMRSAVAEMDFGEHALSMRIGIASGPVVAGIIGRTRFSYDVWGDTVNTASRMESHGESGAIQVSRASYEKLKGSCLLEPRGTIEVKGKGPMETWRLVGLKPA